VNEYEQFLSMAERLTFKQNQTPEESALYDLVTMLIEAYEVEHYQIDRSSPSEVLQHIIESSGIDPAELAEIFGSSESVVQVLAGTKSIDPNWAQSLGNRFKLSPTIFLQS
jgi:HTH-type transcriptional regulator / antitoxin HigA